MPFLIAIAVYAHRIAHRPMDARLKRQHVGPLVVACLLVVLYLAWDWLKPADVSLDYFAGEFPGVTSMYLMVWALVLATRARWLEQWFGGLDRMYYLHRQYALLSMVLLVLHVLLTHVHDTGRQAQAGHLLGVVAAIGLLAFTVISLARIGRILRLPYERWLVLHRLTGMLVLSALVHGYLSDRILAASFALRVIYMIVGAVGMVAYAYDELVRRRRAPKAEYVVHSVERPSPDIVDVTLAPAGSAALPVKGGQFVYLRVGGGRAWREHPFSIAGTQPDGSVRMTVRALGRDTRRLYTDLRIGLPAELQGPYGMFDHTLGGARQIWIAGGIGIAPFLGWISAAQPGQLSDVELFYCTPTAADAPFLTELAAAGREPHGLNLHTVFSRSEGRLSIEKIEAAAGPLAPDTHVFICGPARMTEKITTDLRRHGLPRDNIHAEHFAFR